MVKFILIKSPDEWATTKQACRDEFVVSLFFSHIYRSLYFYVLSTVLRISSFTLLTALNLKGAIQILDTLVDQFFESAQPKRSAKYYYLM